MKQLTKNILDTSYNALTDTYTYIVYSQVEVEYKDECGSWWETELVEIENIDMSSSDLKKDYGSNISLENHLSCIDELKELYKIQ